ncbi:MAG: hypothetical protein KGV57_01220 [Fusobacterium sp.]|nr:hypothetical protein [Fusobacterium sp.]
MKNSLLIPNLYGVFEVKSYSENRIRLVIEKLKNNRDEIDELKNKLRMIDGIINFKIVEILGSLTVEFDSSKINSELMLGIILNLLALENELFKKRDGKLKTIFNNLIDVSNISIYNKSKGFLDTKTALGILLLLYGVKKLKSQPVLPMGATLIWWSYNLLKGKNN